MNAKKLFYSFVAGLVVLFAGVIAVAYYGNQYLIKQNGKLNALKLEAKSLEQSQSSLAAAKKDIQQYSSIEQIAKTVVPQEKDQARTVREIVKIAADSGVPIESVSFTSSTLGTKKSSGTANTNTETTQTVKVEGLTNVEKLPVTITSSSRAITYTSFVRFLENLEQNRRTSQVEIVDIQPVADNRNLLTFTLVLNVYIKK